MPQGLDDKKLLSGCLAGQKECWDLWVERHSRFVYWAIWKVLEGTKVPSKEDLCREVFQDFFEKLLEPAQLERLTRIENVPQYLRVMACHRVFSRLRKAARSEKLETPLECLDPEKSVPAALGDLSREVLTAETRGIVSGALENLSPKEKACVEFHYLDGRTHREIGLILDLPQDTVSTILRRAKDKLRRRLEEKRLSGDI